MLSIPVSVPDGMDSSKVIASSDANRRSSKVSLVVGSRKENSSKMRKSAVMEMAWVTF
jgi:hypothetical protein